MEALKQRRGPLRGSFTRAANSLEEQLNFENPSGDEIAGLLALCQEKTRKLSELQEGIMATMQAEGCTQDDYDREYEAAEVYEDRGSLLKSKADRILKRLESPRRQTEVRLAAAGTQAERRKYRLPEIVLRQFDGSPKDWLGFWGQFNKIHEDTELDGEDKYQYLIQATTPNSKARELVESFPPTAANYLRAVEHLKGRFGRAETLVEVYVRELLRLVLENAMSHRSRENISELYDKLETQLRALETLGVTKDKYASMLYPLVESCLPGDSLRIWERYRISQGSSNEDEGGPNRLTSLMTFLKNEVEGEERIRMARTGFGLSLESKKKKGEGAVVSGETATAAGLFTGQAKGGQERKELGCVFCGKGHHGKDCRNVAKWSYEDKRKVLTQRNCCFACFKPGHLARFCRSPPNCPRCSRRHFEVLCRGLSTKEGGEDNPASRDSTALSNVSCSPAVLLQTLTVVLHGTGADHAVQALIDTGSQRSYITKRAADKMGYQCVGSEKLSHLLFGGVRSSSREHRKFRVFMSSVKMRFHCNFEVLEQDVICEDVPTMPQGPWIRELKEHGIELTRPLEESKEAKREITILIGADIAGKIFCGPPLQLISGPVAMETRLGWVLMGKVNPTHCEESSGREPVLAFLNREATLSDLWSLDSLGILDPVESKTREELAQAALEHFENTIQRTEIGRY